MGRVGVRVRVRVRVSGPGELVVGGVVAPSELRGHLVRVGVRVRVSRLLRGHLEVSSEQDGTQ